MDIPICAVQDGGYLTNPRYSLQFPPNNYNTQYVNNMSKYFSDQPMPVGSININSQLQPINTITGLQNFLGKTMNSRIYREKAVPRVGLGKKKVDLHQSKSSCWLRRVTHNCVIEYLILKKTFLQDFLVILKRKLQNYQKILKKCFLATYNYTESWIYAWRFHKIIPFQNDFLWWQPFVHDLLTTISILKKCVNDTTWLVLYVTCLNYRLHNCVLPVTK